MITFSDVQLSISRRQKPSVDSGAITRMGCCVCMLRLTRRAHAHLCTTCSIRLITWIVLPRPISSARMLFLPSL